MEQSIIYVGLDVHKDTIAVAMAEAGERVVTGVTPDRVTTDGHDSYPRAIRTVLGTGVRHRDSQYLNNRLEQDHRGVKGRYGPMRGFKCSRSAGEFCRAYDELRNFLRSRSRANQQVSADYRRFHFLRRTATVLRVLQAA
jgi:putative transposase